MQDLNKFKKYLIAFGLVFSFIVLLILLINNKSTNDFRGKASVDSLTNSYFVSVNGKDTNNGTTIDTPFRTISKALTNLLPGSTLFIMPGEYNEALIGSIPGGTSSLPVSIKAFDKSQPPTLFPQLSSSNIPLTDTVVYFGDGNRSGISTQGIDQHNIIVDGLIINAKYVGSTGIKISDGANHIKIMNTEVMNAHTQGILLSNKYANWPDDRTIIANSNYNELIGLNVHNNGVDYKQNHGIYVGTDNNVIDGCIVHDNIGYGIHVYKDYFIDAHDNIIKNNVVYNHNQKAGILLAGGKNNFAYNNISYNNYYGIRIAYGADNTKVYNNTIYNNIYGIEVQEPYTSTYIGTIGQVFYTTNTKLVNNIIFKNSTKPINDLGSNTYFSTNLSNDPLFANEATHDFHLTSSSPAINKGVTLTDVLSDIAGNSRDSINGYDIGAYEYVSPSVSPQPTTISTSTTPSVSEYIYKSKGDLNGDAKVDISDLSILATNWITTNSIADINNDNSVDILDLSILATYWGQIFL